MSRYFGPRLKWLTYSAETISEVLDAVEPEVKYGKCVVCGGEWDKCSPPSMLHAKGCIAAAICHMVRSRLLYKRKPRAK